MKNLLKSTLYLFVFALAGILFQISCSSDSISTSSTPLGKIVYTKRGGGLLQIWTCNYDGTAQAQIPITLPSNVNFNFWSTNNTAISASDETSVRLSPDGQNVFFATVTNPGSGSKYFSIYTCNLSGNNLTEILTEASGQDPLVIGGVY